MPAGIQSPLKNLRELFAGVAAQDPASPDQLADPEPPPCMNNLGNVDFIIDNFLILVLYYVFTHESYSE